MTTIASGLILASMSPRRARILSALGVPFRVMAPAVDEESGDDFTSLTRRNAVAKFAWARQHALSEAVLAADTVVLHAGRVLGKPRDQLQAREWLRAYANTRQLVVTSVAWGRGHDSQPTVLTDMAEVLFRAYDAATVAEYLARVNPMDKAGGYDIADCGEVLIEAWQGAWSTIMGLPAAPVAAWLGVPCPIGSLDERWPR